MTRTPNFEQVKAIEHRGGVLLKAGAGSGKTFVLVEHLIYLTGLWITEFKRSQNSSFDEFIRLKFSQVVMMTFTKKAAGEMSVRLVERFQEQVRIAPDDRDLWSLSNEYLPLLNVTTIDGFCKKLIANGFFPSLSPEAEVIFFHERNEQIKKLFNQWLESQSIHLEEELLSVIRRKKKEIIKSLSLIFNDPGVRLQWKNFTAKDLSLDEVNLILQKSFNLNNISNAIEAIKALDLPVTKERSAFEKTIGVFQETGLPAISGEVELKMYMDIFLGYKSLQPEKTASKKDVFHDLAHQGLVALRDWVKEWSVIYFGFKNFFEEKIHPWANFFQKVFLYIEKNVDPNRGLTFGDIEYNVFIGLQNLEIRSRVQNQFQYFIVDEFQDTSELQFEIIKFLVGENYSKLFCVGDAKQAIYGFRGGELSVFNQCSDAVPLNLSLANNYRSKKEIILFNNSLFQFILPKGAEYKGGDIFSVEPEDQRIPDEIDFNELGAVEVHEVNAQNPQIGGDELSTDSVNRLEAIVIAEAIAKEKTHYPKRTNAILYQKLKPSNELIKALMDNKIGFTAQFKIDLLDDPVLCIFMSLLRRNFDHNVLNRDKFCLMFIEALLKVLKCESKLDEDILNNFDLDLEYWGINIAFRKFVEGLNISNENSDLNLQKLEVFYKLFNGDREQIFIHLMNSESEKISLDLRFGIDAHLVQIMSAHASKGLEFETVYLGGVYTNGKDQTDSSILGKLPGSFTWFLDIAQKKSMLTPHYFFENEIYRYKNFSESKRLFYVACTRAKLKLVWVDLLFCPDNFKSPKNSWIEGLRKWRSTPETQSHLTTIKHGDFFKDSFSRSESSLKLPLYFYDPVGILKKNHGRVELGIIPELSVTRLNSLIDCPRKFYFENVLKMNKDQSEVFYDQEELVSPLKKSSAERGTFIHDLISRSISKQLLLPREAYGTEYQKPLAWVVSELQKLKPDFEFFSEVPIKFSLFNFMISGIPDLVLIPKADSSTQIWDFKTGIISETKLLHYWFQLYVYAYAHFILGKVDHNSKVILILSFVDEEKNISKTVTFDDCVEYLYPIWQSQSRPWIVNPEHCSQCPYGDICPR
jgi:ATP-dependent helicase/nuclease subunit A